jgi:uncharacterized protein YbjT (DUF2867 family)
MITVMGATGNTGSKIVHTLLAEGERVRAVGRSAQRLAPLAAAGAELAIGDAADEAFLASAFRGADAVYTLVAADRGAVDYRAAQDALGQTIVEAVRRSEVRRVVALSSLGAELPAGTGPIAGLHAQEQRLLRLDGVHLTLLRPASFFENFAESLPLIESEGIVADAVRAELALPMVATRDIADLAARELRERRWTGTVVRELLGPRDLSYAEATRLLGEALGKPDLAYVELPGEQLVAALVAAGLSPSFATSYLEMTQAFDGRVRALAGRTAENTTPTSFEEWAAGLARR